MAQSFVVQSEKLRDKLNALLPSQNRNSIGVDLSGSTQIIPIVDLTEVAEGSNIREDLQTSLSLTSITDYSVSAASTTIINTTGYFRVFGISSNNGATTINFNLFDGTTRKELYSLPTGSGFDQAYIPFDFVVFIAAGQSLAATSSNTTSIIKGCTRQIADISGNLVNP